MSKIRTGVVLVVLLLLGTPVLASDQFIAPSPTAFLADLWSEVVDVVELVFQKLEAGDESGPPDPDGGSFGPELDSSGDEFGPDMDPNG